MPRAEGPDRDKRVGRTMFFSGLVGVGLGVLVALAVVGLGIQGLIRGDDISRTELAGLFVALVLIALGTIIARTGISVFKRGNREGE
ncbi:hypothetical protein [Curtobacterium sp. MCBD17_040]|uniref:hypothetical protein n=1 Tax=Curtobacterium sp. MCBD17_040 TaxID=2175674 RepID=UPI0011B50D7A|nr:hypothetical protein [Curtobacterium sp. MCBD17_040]WIB65488.1 hypothetical protein DEI94_19130 [Curtobacterium sp. MCBD17_040]